MKKVVIVSLVILVVAALGFAAKGKIAPLSWGLWGEVNSESGVVLRGYDVVSYHTTATPTVGLSEYSSEFNGTTWHFSTAKNKALFDTDPERYMPMYGGFCAFAVYNNVTADVNPRVWHIENDRLYLFASDGPKKDWIAQISQSAIETSDHNWAHR